MVWEHSFWCGSAFCGCSIHHPVWPSPSPSPGAPPRSEGKCEELPVEQKHKEIQNGCDRVQTRSLNWAFRILKSSFKFKRTLWIQFTHVRKCTCCESIKSLIFVIFRITATQHEWFKSNHSMSQIALHKLVFYAVDASGLMPWMWVMWV